MMSSIKAILFDIGGVLVNKSDQHERDMLVIQQMARVVGSTEKPEDFLSGILAGENRYKKWRHQSLAELPLEERWTKYYLPAYPLELVRSQAGQLQRLWSESRGRKWVEAGTVEVIKELKNRGYVLGTVSHTSPRYLAEAGIAHLFCSSVHAAVYGWRKPHPSMFLAGARACGVQPCECAYVGDKPSRDVIGPREAGIGKVVLVQRNGKSGDTDPCPMEPDLTIRTIRELLDYFPKVNGQKSASVDCESKVLYDAGLSTMWWDKDKYTADEFFSRGRRLGFARFELNHQIPVEVLQSIDLDRFHIGSLHDPCPAVIPNKQLEREDKVITSLDENRRQFAVDGVKYTIEQAHELGARSVVIHTGRVDCDHAMDDELRRMYRAGEKGTAAYLDLQAKLISDRVERGKPHLEVLMRSLDDIIAFAAPTGLTLGFENRLHYYELPIFSEMEVILAEFQQPWIGWQLDVGHLQVLSELGLQSFGQWLDRFSQRIMGVHLHDVRGILDHQSPGRGEVDFGRIAACLPPYALRTLEIDKAVPFEEMQFGLENLARYGCINKL